MYKSQFLIPLLANLYPTWLMESSCRESYCNGAQRHCSWVSHPTASQLRGCARIRLGKGRWSLCTPSWPQCVTLALPSGIALLNHALNGRRGSSRFYVGSRHGVVHGAKAQLGSTCLLRSLPRRALRASMPMAQVSAWWPWPLPPFLDLQPTPLSSTASGGCTLGPWGAHEGQQSCQGTPHFDFVTKSGSTLFF